MTVAKLRFLQWFNVIPLPSVEKLREFVYAHLSREDPVAKAIETAKVIAEAGEWRIRFCHQKIGALCLGIGRKDRSGEIVHWIDLTPEIHFKGRYSKVPNIQEGGFITFKVSLPAIGEVHRISPSSYLSIVSVR